jgi:hypothetical protein
MFLQTKFENKFCSSQTVSRVPLSQWENLKSWSKMVLNNRTIDSLPHQRKKLKYYAIVLMHTGNNVSPFHLRKR